MAAVYRDRANTLTAPIYKLSDESAYPDGAVTVSVEAVLSDGTSWLSEASEELTVSGGRVSLPLTESQSDQSADKAFVSILADDIEPIEIEVDFFDTAPRSSGSGLNVGLALTV